jgi:hypothetical protein
MLNINDTGYSEICLPLGGTTISDLTNEVNVAWKNSTQQSIQATALARRLI